MPVFKLAPIDIRANDEKWGASNLKEVVWVEARDEMEARHLVERATLQMQDVKPGKKLNIFSPWLDDVVTLCLADREAAGSLGDGRRQSDKALIRAVTLAKVCTRMTKIPQRLPPTPSTIKRLFAYSGNQCAMPDCSEVSVDPSEPCLARLRTFVPPNREELDPTR